LSHDNEGCRSLLFSIPNFKKQKAAFRSRARKTFRKTCDGSLLLFPLFAKNMQGGRWDWAERGETRL